MNDRREEVGDQLRQQQECRFNQIFNHGTFDGNSEIDAHKRSNICYLIKSWAFTNWENTCFPSRVRNMFWVNMNISTMYLMMKIYLDWESFFILHRIRILLELIMIDLTTLKVGFNFYKKNPQKMICCFNRSVLKHCLSHILIYKIQIFKKWRKKTFLHLLPHNL